MNENRLISLINKKINTSKRFLEQTQEDIKKSQLTIKYYQGQIDALNLTLSTIEKYKGEK